MLQYKLFLIQGLYFEILDAWEDKKYHVKFVEHKNNEKHLLYEVGLKKGMWAKIGRRYLSDYHIEVWDGEELKQDISFLEDIKGKRVFICFDSKSLGDTISWMPYCLPFQEKYGCKVIVSTFLNYLFEKAYPELEFVGRGVVVNDIVAMLEIGWFYDKDKEPQHPATVPLQQAATNILHLPYEEIIPRLDFIPTKRLVEGKYVCISTHSTAKLKYWDYWQEVIDYLVGQGYQVFEVSKDDTDYKNLSKMPNKSIPMVMNYLHYADFYMGLSSGISWLAWGMRKKVFMIANFTDKEHEFQTECIRITDESVCHGCWHNIMFKFDKSSWGYCPENEDTPDEFICHKAIKAQRVIDEIKKAGF